MVSGQHHINIDALHFIGSDATLHKHSVPSMMCSLGTLKGLILTLKHNMYEIFFIHLLLLPFGFHSPSGLSRQLKCYQPFNPSIVCKQASVSPHIILVRLKPRMVQNQVIHTTVTATQDMMEKRNLIGKKCK